MNCGTDVDEKREAAIEFDWLAKKSVPDWHEARIIQLQPLSWKDELRDKDPEEAQARAAFCRSYLQQQAWGPILAIADREMEVSLKVIKNKDRTRDIRVRIGARTRRQSSFNLQILQAQGSQSDGDSNAFDTTDFDKYLNFDSLGYARDKTLEELKGWCFKYDTHSLGTQQRENMKRRILTMYDKWQSLVKAKKDRDERVAEEWLSEEAPK